MNITLICVGKLKERFWKEACKEYLKRLSAYAHVQVVEVSDYNPALVGGDECARKKEAGHILAAIPPQSMTILLAIQGKQMSSVDISRYIDHLALQGVSSISFIIGGSTGCAPEIFQQADELLSLGNITLPHNLARVVLLEQIYRAFKISHGEPYHK